MILKRRVLALVIAALMLVSVSAINAQDDPVELTIVGVTAGPQFQWLTEIVEPAFEAMMAEQGTPVDVNVIEFLSTSGEDLRQQYVLDLGVGGGGDIMSFDGFWLPEFVQAGLLKPLTEVAGEQVMEWDGWEQIPQGLQDILGFEGEIYGVAAGTDARVIWYNRDIFEQAGLPADWQPASWDEVLEAARQIKEALPEVTPIQLNAGTAMGEATTMQGYLMALLGTGHHIYDSEQGKWIIRSQGILDTLELYDTIYNQEDLGNSRFQLVQNGRDLSFEAFSNGEVAMLVEGDFFWRGPIATGGNFPMENRDEVVTFALMPAQEPGGGFNGQDFVTISGGTGFVLNANSENPELAWELMEFLFSPEMLAEFQALQPRIRARQDVPVTGDETMSRIASDVLPFTTVRPPLPEYNQVSQQAQLMTERVVSGEMTPQEAMDAYANAVTDIVGAENVIELPLDE